MLIAKPALVVNWPRILDQVRGAGYAMSEVAQYTGIPKSTLLGYQNLGAEPRHSSGLVLLRFWSEVTGAPIDEAPMMQRRYLAARATA